ncbi:hypothetical protein [Dactylosporangium darangshiense]|uniref:hypothetical protein n=1 Tax=Dactylosporangium darangshiense TaxID=579108 RepID=UPI00363EBEF8
MEEAEPHLRTWAQLEWLDRLRPEQDNIYAAVSHVCDVGDGLSAFRFGAANGWFWTFEDNHADATMWLRRILAVADSGPEPVPLDLQLVVRSMYVVNSGLAGDFQYDPGQLEELIELAAVAPPAGTRSWRSSSRWCCSSVTTPRTAAPSSASGWKARRTPGPGPCCCRSSATSTRTTVTSTAWSAT